MNKTVSFLGIEERLRELGLSVSFGSNIRVIKTDLAKDICIINCLSDIQGARGVRRSKDDPNKLKFVFVALLP